MNIDLFNMISWTGAAKIDDYDELLAQAVARGQRLTAGTSYTEDEVFVAAAAYADWVWGSHGGDS